MSLAQWDQEIQTLPPYSAHQPFTPGIRLRRPHRSSPNPHTQGCQFLIQLSGEDAVTVMDYEAIRVVARERFPELLQGPLGRGMIRYPKVEDLAAAKFHHDEYIKDAEPGREHHQEITGNDHLGVITDEGQPPLGRILSGTTASTQILPHRAGRDSNSQPKLQFVGDPLFTPGDVLCCHGADELLQVLRELRSSYASGFTAPEKTESLAVPTYESVGLDDNKSVGPIKPPTQSGHDPASGVVCSMRLNLTFPKQGELFSEEEVLGSERAGRPEEEKRQPAAVDENAKKRHDAVPEAPLGIRGRRHEGPGSHGRRL